MALTIYQEILPFSNERLDQPVSKDGAYTNPIVMPLSFDVVQYNNSVETVFYIRNNDTRYFYNNVLVTLCKKDDAVPNPTDNRSVFIYKDNSLTLRAIYEDVEDKAIELSYSSDVLPTSMNTPITLIKNYEMPIGPTYDQDISVKFSYGYDELSNVDWATKKEGLLIASIGNSTMPDTSYIPIRMRIEILMDSLPLYTLRDYKISIAYASETEVGQVGS